MTRHEGYDRVRRWVVLDLPAEAVWKEVGAFEAIGEWHPAITAVDMVEIEGDTHRHLTTADGSMILERLTGTGAHHYAYEIVDGPLPVTDYRAVFSVAEEGEGCHVFWSAHFEAEDPAADDIVAGIFETGLEALRMRFAGV